ncbi:hypothetical protein CRYUN_Cryun39dG0039200 [Craigia yunnanensis]
MASNTSLDTALLPEALEIQEESTETSCWRKVLDVVEVKKQVLFALPMILTNVFYYAITLVSVMFSGHLGELELAGATLANSWASHRLRFRVIRILIPWTRLQGISSEFPWLSHIKIGLSGALETLCGQGFGAKTYRMLGIYLQASCIISCLFSIIISILWFYTEPILILLHQEPEIAKTADLYIKYLIPAVFAFGFVQNVLRFLQTQSIVMPLVLFSGLPLALHFGIVYTLVNWTSLGFKGASLAASISLWISFLCLAIYVVCSKKFEQTWEGFSFESFRYNITDLRLALPSAAMVWIDAKFRNSYFTDSNVFQWLILSPAMTSVNTEAIAFNFTYGLSAAASTRVSNELGAEKPDRANDSSSVVKEFASMTPFLATSITVDSFQRVLSGVARGCGWQHLVVVANLAAFYAIGMPIAVLLGFKFKLYAKGLWTGLICGISSQVFTLLLIHFIGDGQRLIFQQKEIRVLYILFKQVSMER